MNRLAAKYASVSTIVKGWTGTWTITEERPNNYEIVLGRPSYRPDHRAICTKVKLPPQRMV